MKKFVALTIVAAVLQSGLASAQGRGTRPHASDIPPSDRVLIFNDELVQGQLVRPDQATVRGNRRGTAVSLLRVRQHFVQEMFRSVENL